MVKRKKAIGFKPDYAVVPGETLRETLASLNMSQAELAERCGRPKKTINEIIAGKAAITAETALQLERVLGIPASFWTKLESNYQETKARLKEEQNLREQVAWLNHFPLKAMARFGWLTLQKDPVENLRKLLNFFGVAGSAEWEEIWLAPQANFRKSQVFEKNPHALAAWLRQGELRATAQPCADFQAVPFRKALEKIRGFTTLNPMDCFIQIQEFCAQAGVCVVHVPELPGTHAYAATRWLNGKRAIIQLSLRGKTDDHFWFSFFHEAGHVLQMKIKSVVIHSDEEKTKTDQEYAADHFARNYLLPEKVFNQFLAGKDFSEQNIIRFAQRLQVSPGIVVGRLQYERRIPYSFCNHLKNKIEIVQ